MDPPTVPPIVLQRLTLRTLSETDADGPYLQWMRDPEILQYLEARFRTFTHDDLARYVQTMNADPRVFLFGILITDTAQHIGNIKLGPIDRNHKVGDVGILIGAKEHWGQGFATEAIRGLTKWATGSQGLHKLTAGCYHLNHGSIRAFLKAGWFEEGRRREQYQCGDQRVDGVLLAYLKEPPG